MGPPRPQLTIATRQSSDGRPASPGGVRTCKQGTDDRTLDDLLLPMARVTTMPNGGIEALNNGRAGRVPEYALPQLA